MAERLDKVNNIDAQFEIGHDILLLVDDAPTEAFHAVIRNGQNTPNFLCYSVHRGRTTELAMYWRRVLCIVRVNRVL